MEEKIFFEWTKIIETNTKFMKIIGIWPKESFFTCNFYNFYAHFTVTFLLILHILLLTIKLILISDDIQLFLSALTMVMQLYHLLIKFLYFILKFPVLKKIFETLENHILFQPKNNEQKTELESKLGLVKKYYVSFYSMAIVAVSLMILYPIFDGLMGGGERQLLLLCWFPFDSMKSPYFELTYFYQSVSIIYACIMVLQIDTFVTLLMTYIGLQCDLLCENLKNVGYISPKPEWYSSEEEFKKCIKHHQGINKFSEMCTDFCYMLIFVQVATSSLAIGLTLFQMTFVISTFNLVFLIFYGLSVAFQMFQYCWFGSEVIYKSSKIAYSAFEMNFLEVSLSTKKNLVVFMACTQKPIKMPILNVTHLSLETFTKVLQTAWSYFALLLRIGE